jgi:hypothetical protein
MEKRLSVAAARCRSVDSFAMNGTVDETGHLFQEGLVFMARTDRARAEGGLSTGSST